MTGRWSARLAELRAELTVLRGAHRALAERVVSMESRAHRARTARAAKIGRDDAHASDIARVLRASEAAGADAERERATQEEAAVASAQAEVAPDGAFAPAASEPEPPSESFDPMTLPAKPAVLACLKQLLDVELELTVSKRAPPESPAELEVLYASPLLDDANVVVGAILLSVPLAARMGGALLGLPEGAIADQVRARVLEEEALAAMSEVCNNLSGPVNRGAGGCHVRSGELAPFAAEAYPWLARASKIMCLTDGEGDAFWIVAR